MFLIKLLGKGAYDQTDSGFLTGIKHFNTENGIDWFWDQVKFKHSSLVDKPGPCGVFFYPA